MFNWSDPVLHRAPTVNRRELTIYSTSTTGMPEAVPTGSTFNFSMATLRIGDANWQLNEPEAEDVFVFSSSVTAASLDSEDDTLVWRTPPIQVRRPTATSAVVYA